MLAAVLFYSLLFLVLVVFPASLILLFHLFIDHERRLWKRVSPAIAPWWKKLIARPSITKIRTRHPRALSFVARRLDPHDPWGLPATIAAVAVIAGLWFLASIIQDLVGKDPLVLLDIRLHNAVPLFRSKRMTWLMLALTETGSPPVLFVVCIGSALIAWSRQRQRLAATFILAIAGTSALSVILKALFGHARPTDALIAAHEASFPSGHVLSGAVVYGLFISLLLRSRLRLSLRALGTVLLILLVVAIGLSRLYLGVHWPSDLLGSLALSLVCLAVLLFFLNYERPLRRIDEASLGLSPRVLTISGTVVLVGAAVFAAVLVRDVKMAPVGPPPPVRRIALSTFSSSIPADIPRSSEGLLGEQMEPISIVLVGSKEDVIRSFENAGWTLADLPTPVRVVKEGLAAIQNRPDASGPATPAFLGDHPQAMTFEKPDAKAPGIRHRHHTRLWQTPYCTEPDCRPIWVATASFDVGVELSAKLHLPTHRIDPNIDAERALIASDLVGARAQDIGAIRVTAPFRGTNAAGDAFATDGRAVIVVMPSQGSGA